jgi:uncharacterized membrane protein
LVRAWDVVVISAVLSNGVNRMLSAKWEHRSTRIWNDMSVLYGLSAAAFFGTADFFATKSARRVGVIRTLLAVQIFGLLAMIAVVLIKGESPQGSASAWLEMALISVVSFGGVLLLYRAFAIGTLSLVSPIASGFAVVTAGLALASG